MLQLKGSNLVKECTQLQQLNHMKKTFKILTWIAMEVLIVIMAFRAFEFPHSFISIIALNCGLKYLTEEEDKTT